MANPFRSDIAVTELEDNLNTQIRSVDVQPHQVASRLRQVTHRGFLLACCYDGIYVITGAQAVHHSA